MTLPVIAPASFPLPTAQIPDLSGTLVLEDYRLTGMPHADKENLLGELLGYWVDAGGELEQAFEDPLAIAVLMCLNDAAIGSAGLWDMEETSEESPISDSRKAAIVGYLTAVEQASGMDFTDLKNYVNFVASSVVDAASNFVHTFGDKPEYTTLANAIQNFIHGFPLPTVDGKVLVVSPK